MKLVLAHPGASWATADVFDGLNYGLKQHGVDVIHYRLDNRIPMAKATLNYAWRQRKKVQPDAPRPGMADIIYQASVGVLECAMRHRADIVLIVSAMLMHPDVILMMKQAGLKVFVLFTESPYDHTQEMRIAAMVDGCWTNERTVVPAFRAVNANAGYLPHAFHPLKHFVSTRQIGELPSHDVVFVGSGFAERISWFNAIDWTGIDLGLYGTWKGLGLKPQVKAAIRGDQVTNDMAASLYRRAKIGLNLYRKSRGWGRHAPPIAYAESLSPRAYELAACGAFSLSDDRAEVQEVFGALVPTFKTPTEAAALMRLWLADDAGRARVQAALPACVAEANWVNRATTVIGDLQSFLEHEATQVLTAQ